MKVSHNAIARALLLSSAMFAAGCVPAPDSTPAPTPAPVQTSPPPAPAPSPMPAPAPENWIDAARTPGDWTYRSATGGSVALYGEAQTDARFSIRCDSSARSITFSRAGNAASTVPMRILTETAQRTLNAQPTGGGLPYLTVTVPARDPLLDAMALTKGRFAVEVAGTPTLYLPAWAEVTRVIEDCR